MASASEGSTENGKKLLGITELSKMSCADFSEFKVSYILLY